MTAELALIDIDETLTPRGVNSWVELTNGLGGSVEDLLSSLNRLRSGDITIGQAKGEVLQNWQQQGRANNEEITRVLGSIPLVGGAQDFIDDLVARNIEPILVTGSMNIYAAAVASRLGISIFEYNSELIFNEQGDLTGITYEPDQATKKLEQAKRLAAKRALSPQDCIAIGEGSNDLKLFEWAGTSFAVASDDAEILRLATHKVDDLSEVVDRLGNES